MRISQVTPGLIPIPPNGWGAVEKIIWEYHCISNDMGHDSHIKYLNDVDPSSLGQLQINGLAAKDQMRLSAINQAYKDLTKNYNFICLDNINGDIFITKVK
jgi:hypothetical protein